MPAVLFLILSLLAFGLGPLVAHLGRDRGKLLAWLEALVVVAIFAVVGIGVLPSALARLGWYGLVPLACGLILPAAIEWRARGPISAAVLAGLSLALAAHAVVDGTALNTHAGHVHAHAHAGDQSLAAAVALHRSADGLLLWWLIAPRAGTRWAVAALVLCGAASVAGFWLSEALVDRLPDRALTAIEALIAGSMLHVLWHHEPFRSFWRRLRPPRAGEDSLAPASNHDSADAG